MAVIPLIDRINMIFFRQLRCYAMPVVERTEKSMENYQRMSGRSIFFEKKFHAAKLPHYLLLSKELSQQRNCTSCFRIGIIQEPYPDHIKINIHGTFLSVIASIPFAIYI